MLVSQGKALSYKLRLGGALSGDLKSTLHCSPSSTALTIFKTAKKKQLKLGLGFGVRKWKNRYREQVCHFFKSNFKI